MLRLLRPVTGKVQCRNSMSCRVPNANGVLRQPDHGPMPKSASDAACLPGTAPSHISEQRKPAQPPSEISSTSDTAKTEGIPEPDAGGGMPEPDPGGPTKDGGGRHNRRVAWSLGLLCLSYLHHSTSGFALPSFMPDISRDLHLLDTQASLLTLGYAAFYALALVPVGILADRVNRVDMLTVAITAWSCLIMAASKASGFESLLAVRLFFAAAQAAQNPVCFSLIPELFPNNRTGAMALYNSAIYLGRALSFAALYFVSGAHSSQSVGVTLVPVDDFDPSQWSLLYTVGNQAAVAPLFNYNYMLDYGPVSTGLWRTLLFGIGPPGLVIAWLMSITLSDPRHPKKVNILASSRFFISPPQEGDKRSWEVSLDNQDVSPVMAQATGNPAATSTLTAKDAAKVEKISGKPSTVRQLLQSRPFLAVTAAATVNDLANWSLVAWQAEFYQRVFEIGPEVYALLLACAIPIGGIVGGVGGGLLADRLKPGWSRAWLTCAANLAAAPVLSLSLVSDDYHMSFIFLTIGFALSEAWRAPSAIMIRDIADESLGATGSAFHLCIRNLLGGLGPLGIAVLSQSLGDNLQRAMLAVPVCYALSGLLFLFAQAVAMEQQQPHRHAPVSNN